MADERNFPYSIVWVAFIISLIVGAGLLMSPSGGKQALGLAFILGPVILFGLLTGLYYWRSRRLAAT